MARRIEQVNELIKQELGALLIREIEFPPQTVVTITKVSIDADMKLAKIFIIAHPAEHAADAMKILKRSTKPLQYALNHTLSMHYVPQISFQVDPNPDERDTVEDIFDELDKEKKEH